MIAGDYSSYWLILIAFVSASIAYMILNKISKRGCSKSLIKMTRRVSDAMPYLSPHVLIAYDPVLKATSP